MDGLVDVECVGECLGVQGVYMKVTGEWVGVQADE